MVPYNNISVFSIFEKNMIPRKPIMCFVIRRKKRAPWNNFVFLWSRGSLIIDVDEPSLIGL